VPVGGPAQPAHKVYAWHFVAGGAAVPPINTNIWKFGQTVGNWDNTGRMNIIARAVGVAGATRASYVFVNGIDMNRVEICMFYATGCAGAPACANWNPQAASQEFFTMAAGGGVAGAWDLFDAATALCGCAGGGGGVVLTAGMATITAPGGGVNSWFPPAAMGAPAGGVIGPVAGNCAAGAGGLGARAAGGAAATGFAAALVAAGL